MADERRPMGFWEQFNVWWRTTTTSTGERPRVDDIKRWYDANAGIVWPWGQAPTLEQTKKHAKGMRRLEDIPAYFREYRLKCKGQDHTEDGQDGSPPPPAHNTALADGPTPADIPTATPSTNANNDSPKPQDHLHNARRNSSVATPTAAAAASPAAAAAAQRCPRTCPGPVARSRSRSLARRCGTHLRRPSSPSPGGASSDDWTPSCDEDEDERRHVARRQRRHSAAAAATHRSPAARRPSDPPANGTAATSAAQRQEQQQQQQEGKAEVLDTDKAHNSDNKADVVPNGGQQQKKQPWADGSDLAMSPRRQPHMPLPPLPYDNVQLPPAPAPESVSHAVGPPRAPSPPPLPPQQHAPSQYTGPPLGVPFAVASRTVRQYYSSVTAANGPPVLPPLRPLLHPAGSGVGEAEGDIPCFSASAHPPPMTPARVGRGAMPAHVPGPVFVPHEPIHNQYELPYHKHQLPYSHYSAYAPGPGPFPDARDEQCPPLSGPWGVIPPGAGCMRAGCASPWEGNRASASAPPMGAWADCVDGPVPQLPFLPQERAIPMSGGCAIPNGDTYHAVVTSGWGAVAHSMPVSVGVGTGTERGAGVERAAGSSSLRKRNRSATVGGSSTSTLGSSNNNINHYNHVLNNDNSSSLSGSGSGSVAHSSTAPHLGPAPYNHNNRHHGDQQHQCHLSRGTHHRCRAGRHPNGTPERHTWGGAFPHATQHSLDHTAAAAAAAAAPGSSMYGMYDTYGTPGSTYPGSPATPPALADPWVGWVPNPVAHVEAVARMVPEPMRMDVSPFVAAGHVLDTIHEAQTDQQQQHRRQQQHQQHSGPVVTTGFCPVPLPVASAHVADVSVPAPAPLRCETSVQLPVFYDHTPADQQQQQQQQQLVPAFDSMSLEQLLPGLSGAGEGEIEAGLHDSELVGLDLFGGDLQQLQHSMLGPGEVLVTLKVSPSGATAAAGTAKQQLTGGVGKERAAARGLPGAGGSGTGSSEEGGWAWGGVGDGGGGGGCGHDLMCLDVMEGECVGDGVVGMLPTPFSFVPLV